MFSPQAIDIHQPTELSRSEIGTYVHCGSYKILSLSSHLIMSECLDEKKLLQQGLPDSGHANRGADPHRAMLGCRLHALSENALMHGLQPEKSETDGHRRPAEPLTYGGCLPTCLRSGRL